MSTRGGDAKSNDSQPSTDRDIRAARLEAPNGTVEASESVDITKSLATSPSSGGSVSSSSSLAGLSNTVISDGAVNILEALPVRGKGRDLIIEERGKRTALYNFLDSESGTEEGVSGLRNSKRPKGVTAGDTTNDNGVSIVQAPRRKDNEKENEKGNEKEDEEDEEEEEYEAAMTIVENTNASVQGTFNDIDKNISHHGSAEESVLIVNDDNNNDDNDSDSDDSLIEEIDEEDLELELDGRQELEEVMEAFKRNNELVQIEIDDIREDTDEENDMIYTNGDKVEEDEEEEEEEEEDDANDDEEDEEYEVSSSHTTHIERRSSRPSRPSALALQYIGDLDPHIVNPTRYCTALYVRYKSIIFI